MLWAGCLEKDADSFPEVWQKGGVLRFLRCARHSCGENHFLAKKRTELSGQQLECAACQGDFVPLPSNLMALMLISHIYGYFGLAEMTMLLQRVHGIWDRAMMTDNLGVLKQQATKEMFFGFFLSYRTDIGGPFRKCAAKHILQFFNLLLNHQTITCTVSLIWTVSPKV